MPVLRGVSATGPMGTTATLVGDTIVVNRPAPQFKCITLQCESDAPGTEVPHINPPATISIAPTSVTLTTKNQTAQLTATPLDASGNPTSATVTWTSSQPALVGVNSGGLVTALALNGNATITAAIPGTNISASVPVTTPTQVAQSVAISPASLALHTAAAQPLTATVTDIWGGTMTGVALTWTSNDPAIVVDQSGNVHATAGGQTAQVTATVTATPSATASIPVTSDPPAVAQVIPSPTSATLILGQTLPTTATSIDQFGNLI